MPIKKNLLPITYYLLLLKRLRKAVGIKPGQKYPSCTVKIIVEDQKLPLTVHRATWLILRREENRDDEDVETSDVWSCQSRFVKSKIY